MSQNPNPDPPANNVVYDARKARLTYFAMKWVLLPMCIGIGIITALVGVNHAMRYHA